jgi:hypothetical protein
MINRVTGDLSFHSGLHISPHRAIESSYVKRPLSLKPWRRHVLGTHPSEHGAFEVEALSTEDDRIQIVLLSHQHSFYEPGTPEDADRRVFHEGVISSELAGQREFSWGEVTCRFETALNQDWLVIAYKQQADIPLRDKEVLLHLLARENVPENGT